MQAKDILAVKGPKVETIAASARLGEAIDSLARLRIGALLVTDPDGQPCGMLSERDVVQLLAGAPTGFRETQVSEVMTSGLITCPPDTSVPELMEIMTEKRVRHLPIVEATTLLGILSIGDVVKHRMSEVREEAEALKNYISNS